VHSSPARGVARITSRLPISSSVPELPDIVVYLEALERRVLGRPLERVRLGSPFVLRSVEPGADAVNGQKVLALRRIGKRLVLALEGDLHVVIHLMIAGRLRWRDPGAALPKRRGLAALDFPNGTVLFTEEGTQRRAGLWLVRGTEGLRSLDPGGVEVLDTDLPCFRDALTRDSHTLKRALTDPGILSGIGNAYSDEILHTARLSPFKLTRQLTEDEMARLFRATRETLSRWTDRLRAEAGGRFPEKVTAFRAGMAVHGRFREPCPACGAPIQRIRYAENEANYCAVCQTGGKVLADRALSRLLREDWPRSLAEWERRFG
jgi:formamidopyrimidine-DNA glycosylase